MGLNLREAKGLISSDYQDKDVWNQVNRKEYSLALQKAQQQDLPLIVTKWLYDYAPSVDINNDKIIDLVTNWCLAFKNFSNPFFTYLKNVNTLNVKPTYNDLAAINNAYSENLITNDDLNGACDLIYNSDFYKNRPIQNLKYYLDIYGYFSDVDEYSKKVLNNLPSNYELVISNDEKYTKEQLTQKYMLRNVLLYEDGNPSSKLRDVNKIQSLINNLSKYVNDPNNATSRTKSKQNNKNNYYDEDRLNDFLEKNRELFKDRDFVDDLRLYLS